MSSFKGFADDDGWEDEDGIITLSEDKGNVIRLHGTRFRRFVNTDQSSIHHYLLDQRDCRKVRIKNQWFVECKPHKCRIHCIDSQDTTTPLGYEWGTKPDGSFDLL